MAVILFMPRFHDLVASGAKRQTIRATRKRPIRPGDPLSLRAWEGLPYRSKQRVLRDTACEDVLPIRIGPGDALIHPLRVELDGVLLSLWALDGFAKDDGFADAGDMARWWAENRYLPFHGTVTYWE